MGLGVRVFRGHDLIQRQDQDGTQCSHMFKQQNDEDGNPIPLILNNPEWSQTCVKTPATGGWLILSRGKILYPEQPNMESDTGSHR